MDLLRVMVGVAMLTLGQKLFWLFVGGIGFVYGMHIAGEYFHRQPDWIVIVIALLAGLLGALIAVFLQNVAVWLAGFSAGGYFLVTLLNVFGWDDNRLYWLSFLVGGIIGAVLMAAVFDWALIILSSITGALLIAQSIQFTPQMTVLLFAVLLIVGIIVQFSRKIREEPKPTSSEPAKRG